MVKRKITKEADVEEEPVVEQVQDEALSSPPKPATFKGRLQLNDFAFKSDQPDSTRRRSPRFASSASSTAVSKRVNNSDDQEDDGAKPQKKKRRRARTPAGYAPPSTYAHLPGLPDAIADNLLVLFIGLNPGIQTARTGHAYAHPSNLFWKLLFSSGVTPRPCAAAEDRRMPELYSLGLTNIVARPSRNGAELSRQEMDEGVGILHEKCRRHRPESVCVVGKSIWESIWRVRHGRPVGKAFRYGWQDETENMGVVAGEWEGAKVFVASSTSGLAATLSPAEKERIWGQLGSWVKKRRVERELEAGDKTEEKVDEAKADV